ncbi:Rho termination factor N-terminal domain-containing protein [Isoptericola sp. NPDC055881]
MARKIRDDLDGVVYAYDEGGATVRLAAGDEVPTGVTVGDHLTDGPATDDSDEPKPIDKMTVDELRAHAAEAGVDLGDATKKADIVAAITAAQDAGGDGSDES